MEVPEGDVLDGEGDGVGVGCAGFGALTTPQEEVQRNIGEVGNGQFPVVGLWGGVGVPGFLEQTLDECHRDGKLGKCGRVLLPIGI